MNILITGANGFLGSNLLKTFINLNHNIFAISQTDKNIKQFKNRITFESNTKLNYFDLKDKIIQFSPELVIHCAWSGGNSYSDVNDLNQYYHNIPIGLSLLEIIKHLKNCRFLGIGSFSEYGIIKTKAVETQPDNPNTHYGLSKSSFKGISKIFCEQNNINWSWIRPCYVYGSGDVSTRLIPTVITKLKNKESIRLSSCDVTIDYLHIDDFCSGVVNIVDNRLDGVYNLCSGNEYNLKNILQHMETVSGSRLITFDPLLDRIYASKYICGSNDKLQSVCSWKPKKQIYNELERLFDER